MGALIGHHGLLLGAASSGGGLTGLKSGLVSWWDLEQASGSSRTDSQGTCTLSETGGAVGSGTGKVGTCATTTAGRALSSSSASLAFLSGDFTLAGWIKTSQANQALIANWTTSTNSRRFCLLLEASIAKFGVSTDGTNVSAIATTGSSLADSAWHLLIGWRSTTDGKVYVQVDNGTPAGVAFSAASTLYSGAGNGIWIGDLGGGVYANGGSFDSCGCWNRELTSTERSTLWNSGAGLGYSSL
jgi:hypothetical protein